MQIVRLEDKGVISDTIAERAQRKVGNQTCTEVEQRKRGANKKECSRNIRRNWGWQEVHRETGGGEKTGEKKENNTRPITIKGIKETTRGLIFKNTRNLRNTNIWIEEDLPKKIQEERKELVAKMKEARQKRFKAFLRYDKLLVEGEEENNVANTSQKRTNALEKKLISADRLRIKYDYKAKQQGYDPGIKVEVKEEKMQGTVTIGRNQPQISLKAAKTEISAFIDNNLETEDNFAEQQDEDTGDDQDDNYNFDDADKDSCDNQDNNYNNEVSSNKKTSNCKEIFSLMADFNTGKSLNTTENEMRRLTRCSSHYYENNNWAPYHKPNSAWVTRNKEIVAVRWFDNKDVTMASNFVAIGPVDKVRRWDKKQRSHIFIERLAIFRLYNKSMGRVDNSEF
ncbi:hypothetical protein ILUMI_25065, partial [Ignelater luminosus]